MKEKNKFTFKEFWLPLFIFAVVVICFYKFMDKLPAVFGAIGSFIGIISPFIIGLLIALLLCKPAGKLENLLKKGKNKFFSKHSRGFSVLACYIALLLIIAALLYFIIPRLVSSIVNLVNHVPEYYSSLLKYIDGLAGSDGKVLGMEVSKIKSYINPNAIISYFDFSTVSKYAGELFKATGAIINFSLSVVISIYMLLGREHLIKVGGKLLRMLIPKQKVHSLYRFISRSCNIFYNYLYSQLIDALIVSALCFVIFFIARIPYAILLALLMGVCNLIPYFGAIIGGFGVVFVTLISTGNIVQALIALACVIGAQQLDANVLQPKIVSDSLGIRPIYVLFAITVGGGLFGLVGIIFGVPILAIIRMFIVDYMNNLGNKETPLVQKQEEEIEAKNLGK